MQLEWCGSATDCYNCSFRLPDHICCGTLAETAFAVLQAAADAQKVKNHACHLEQGLAECQCTLDTVTQKAISAEVDLKAALATLSDAEKVMSVSVRRQEAAELVSVISGCIAAFITAAATTVYWLH